MTTYEKHLSEPWFSLIKLGIKKYEGRLNTGTFSNMKKNDIIIFENNDFNFKRSFSCKIKNITKYKTFYDFLKEKQIKYCLPGIDSLDEGVKVYYKYYKKEDEANFGVKSFSLKLIK